MILWQSSSPAADRRIVWPSALGYFEMSRIVVAWCELRVDGIQCALGAPWELGCQAPITGQLRRLGKCAVDFPGVSLDPIMDDLSVLAEGQN